jgi:hypothetical protein
MNASQFRNFSRPGGTNMFDSMSGNRSQSNTFQQEMDKLFGGRETSSGLSRDKDRYYNAFRRYDEEFDRVYRPNQDVDRVYNERRSSRESIYFKAFREKDPRRRAELMKSFQKGEDLAAIRDDSKGEETKPADRRRSTRSTGRSGILGSDREQSGSMSGRRDSGLLGSDRSSSSTSSSRTNRGLLGSRGDSMLGSDDTSNDKEESLTERSRRFSEKIRPGATNNIRGTGRPFP